MIETEISPHVQRYTHFAMGTEYALFADEEDNPAGPAIAAEVFRKIDQLEMDLSRFVEGSDVYRINHARPGTRLHITPDTFNCLQLAAALSRQTGGAFDINYASTRPRNGLMKDVLSLDENGLAVEIAAAGCTIDLGGIGKGYTLDRIGALLADWGMTRCLIHSGGSSLLALDPPAGYPGWPVGVGQGNHRIVVALNRQALAASGTEVRGEHIVDAREGMPAQRTVSTQRTWVTAPQAAVADALSTAFMVLSPEKVLACCASNREVGTILQCHPPEAPETYRMLQFGNWPVSGPGARRIGG